MVVPCAVVECEDKTSPRHRFPDPDRDRNRYNTWVSLTCNMKLRDMDPKRVYANYRIYHRHFAERDIVSNKLFKRFLSKELPNYTDEQVVVDETCIEESSGSYFTSE